VDTGARYSLRGAVSEAAFMAVNEVENMAALVVNGTPGVGKVLTASYPMGRGSVKWQRFQSGVWVDIAGATSLTYLQSGVDAGKQLRAVSTGYFPHSSAIAVPAVAQRVQFTNRTGTPFTISSNTSGLRFFNARNRLVNLCGVAVNNVVVASPPNLQPTSNGAGLEATGQTMLMRGAVVVNGSRHELMWGGVNQVSVPSGGVRDPDPIVFAADIAAMGTVDVIYYVEFPVAPARLCSAFSPGGSDVSEGGATAIADKHMSGTISGRVVNRTLFSPRGCYGVPVGGATPKPAQIIVGDSVAAGQNDNTSGRNGFILRALDAAGYPYAMTAQAGYAYNAAFSSAPSADFLRKMCVYQEGAFKYALVCLGGNDVKAGVSPASVRTRRNAMGQWFAERGLQMIPMTGMPRTNGTNSGPNTVDAGSMADYQQMRLDIIADNGQGHGYWDRMPAIAANGNLTRWRADLGGNVYESDGVHPTTLGHSKLTEELTAALPILLV
jgi:lysophospholipase L1-like esterase